MKKHTTFKDAIKEVAKPIEERVDADLMLPRGEQKILQAVSDKVERGLRVKLLDDGGYDMAYWFKDPSKPYPVEVLVDGESIKKDAKVVEMKFHPEVPEETNEEFQIAEDYKKVIKMYPRDKDWKKLITKHRKAIDDFRNNDKDLPKKVEDELLTWASQTGEVGSKDDAEDFIMDILDEETNEALVASDMNIFNAIVNKIKDDISKDKIAGNFEKSWPKMQALAKIAGYGITKKAQGKNKSYLWKLKK